MLAQTLISDISLAEQFVRFLKRYGMPAMRPDVVLALPDVTALGIYMDFLEQNFNIGITADNYSYIIYLIAVSKDDPHYQVLLEQMRRKGDNIVHHEVSASESTVIQNYIRGIDHALKLQITPF